VAGKRAADHPRNARGFTRITTLCPQRRSQGGHGDPGQKTPWRYCTLDSTQVRLRCSVGQRPMALLAVAEWHTKAA
jgi:hypothetical protein